MFEPHKILESLKKSLKKKKKRNLECYKRKLSVYVMLNKVNLSRIVSSRVNVFLESAGWSSILQRNVLVLSEIASIRWMMGRQHFSQYLLWLFFVSIHRDVFKSLTTTLTPTFKLLNVYHHHYVTCRKNINGHGSPFHRITRISG